LTPSVGFQAGTNAQAVSNIEIRGLGSAGSNRAFEGDVGIFVDGVYLSRAGQLLSNFLDYDNLQILKGPQGTLFGKNTTAGALMLTSTKPQFTDYDGSYEVTVGNYGNVLARVASNIPISDKLAVRVAALISNNDGYVKNPGTDDYYNSHRPRAFKAQLLYEPTADLSFRLIGDISIEHDNCCYGTVVAVPGPAQPLINALTRANGLQLPSARPKDYQAVLNQDTDQQIGDRGAVLLSDWDISTSAALHSTTAYRVWSESQLGGDFDFSGADLLNGNETFKTHQFSQEFTFDGKAGETPLFKSANYLLGVYLAHEVLLGTRQLFWGQQAQTYWNVALAPLGIPPGVAEASPGSIVIGAVSRGRQVLRGIRACQFEIHGPVWRPRRNSIFQRNKARRVLKIRSSITRQYHRPYRSLRCSGCSRVRHTTRSTLTARSAAPRDSSTTSRRARWAT